MPVQGRAGETRVLQDALDTGFLVSILRKDLRSDFQQLRPTRGRSLSLGGAIGQSRLHAPRSCRPPSEDEVRSGFRQIARASSRERVCQSDEMTAVAESL